MSRRHVLETLDQRKRTSSGPMTTGAARGPSSSQKSITDAKELLTDIGRRTSKMPCPICGANCPRWVSPIPNVFQALVDVSTCLIRQSDKPETIEDGALELDGG